MRSGHAVGWFSCVFVCELAGLLHYDRRWAQCSLSARRVYLPNVLTSCYIVSLPGNVNSSLRRPFLPFLLHPFSVFSSPSAPHFSPYSLFVSLFFHILSSLLPFFPSLIWLLCPKLYLTYFPFFQFTLVDVISLLSAMNDLH